MNFETTQKENLITYANKQKHMKLDGKLDIANAFETS